MKVTLVSRWDEPWVHYRSWNSPNGKHRELALYWPWTAVVLGSLFFMVFCIGYAVGKG